MLTLDNLNWEAVATFTAGIAAVAGAVVIGFRQAAILDRQVEIEQLKVKSDLFDKRFATYEATADFLTHINTYMEDPNRVKLGDWLLKYRESQFLFRPSVYVQLNEILNQATKYQLNRNSMAARDAEGLPRIPGSTKSEMELMVWLHTRLTTIHEIFEPDLKLTIPQARRSWSWRNPMKRRG